MSSAATALETSGYIACHLLFWAANDWPEQKYILQPSLPESSHSSSASFCAPLGPPAMHAGLDFATMNRYIPYVRLGLDSLATLTCVYFCILMHRVRLIHPNLRVMIVSLASVFAFDYFFSEFHCFAHK